MKECDRMSLTAFGNHEEKTYSAVFSRLLPVGETSWEEKGTTKNFASYHNWICWEDGLFSPKSDPNSCLTQISHEEKTCLFPKKTHPPLRALLRTTRRSLKNLSAVPKSAFLTSLLHIGQVGLPHAYERGQQREEERLGVSSRNVRAKKEQQGRKWGDTFDFFPANDKFQEHDSFFPPQEVPKELERGV